MLRKSAGDGIRAAKSVPGWKWSIRRQRRLLEAAASSAGRWRAARLLEAELLGPPLAVAVGRVGLERVDERAQPLPLVGDRVCRVDGPVDRIGVEVAEEARLWVLRRLDEV